MEVVVELSPVFYRLGLGQLAEILYSFSKRGLFDIVLRLDVDSL